MLIGHSLGGFVIQRYLEDRNAPAAVLVGSVPPPGVLGLAMRVWRRHPWMTMHGRCPTLLKFIATPALVREYLFCAHTPEAIVESCAASAGSREHPRLPDRSDWSAASRPKRVTTPMLVLGAEHDGFVTIAEVRATARAYRTEPEFFPAWGTT